MSKRSACCPVRHPGRTSSARDRLRERPSFPWDEGAEPKKRSHRQGRLPDRFGTECTRNTSYPEDHPPPHSSGSRSGTVRIAYRSERLFFRSKRFWRGCSAGHREDTDSGTRTWARCCSGSKPRAAAQDLSELPACPAEEMRGRRSHTIRPVRQAGAPGL